MKDTVDLGGGYVLFQPEGVYPCGSDAVLLAAFAAENGEGGRFCDLCCGSGVVAVLVCKRRSDVASALPAASSSPMADMTESDAWQNRSSARRSRYSRSMTISR